MVLNSARDAGSGQFRHIRTSNDESAHHAEQIPHKFLNYVVGQPHSPTTGRAFVLLEREQHIVRPIPGNYF